MAKKHCFFVFFIVVVIGCNKPAGDDSGETCDNCKEITYQVDNLKIKPDKFARYPDGIEGLVRCINENVSYPETVKRRGGKGKVILSFLVSRTGAISNIQIVKGVDAELDSEAIKVIGAIGSWEPAQIEGKPVDMEYMIPIAFGL